VLRSQPVAAAARRARARRVAKQFAHTFGIAAGKFKPGAAYEFRFDTAGVYRYYCSLHGSKTVGMAIDLGAIQAPKK
jgi:plastocyanin